MDVREMWLYGNVQSRPSAATTFQKRTLAAAVLIICFLPVLPSTCVQLAGKLFITE